MKKRTPVMAGNWKMYKSVAQTVEFFEKFKPLVEQSTHCEIVICPPFPSLAGAVELARGTGIRIGGQNLFWEREGAFTGEVSGPMLAAAGCTHVIIGPETSPVKAPSLSQWRFWAAMRIEDPRAASTAAARARNGGAITISQCFDWATSGTNFSKNSTV